jgi:hypothetical protein
VPPCPGPVPLPQRKSTTGWRSVLQSHCSATVTNASVLQELYKKKKMPLYGKNIQETGNNICIKTKHLPACTCPHVDCPAAPVPDVVGSGPGHTDQCVVRPKPAAFWAFVIFVAQFPFSVVCCICRIAWFCTRLSFAVIRLPFSVVRATWLLPVYVVYLPGVRIATWLWVQRQRRRQAAAELHGRISGMLFTGEDQQLAEPSVPPPTLTKSVAAAAADSCICTACCTHNVPASEPSNAAADDESCDCAVVGTAAPRVHLRRRRPPKRLYWNACRHRPTRPPPRLKHQKTQVRRVVGRLPDRFPFRRRNPRPFPRL